MSNRLYDTSKVVDKIGLPDQKKYDKIDVYINTNDKNSLFGIASYTEYKRNNKYVKQDIIRFNDYDDMISFVRNNFNGYELNHHVDILHKQIFIHIIDYLDIEYYLNDKEYEGSFVFNYNEYINDKKIPKKLKLEKKYQEMILHLIKKDFKSNDFDHFVKYVQTSKNKENNKIVAMSDFKYDNSDNKKKGIKNLKIVISTITLGILLANGYQLINKHQDNLNIVTQNNPVLSIKDIEVQLKHKDAGEIIDKLMDGRYENISYENLMFLKEYLFKLESTNYDNNVSNMAFNYTDYFSYKVLKNNPQSLDVIETKNLLNKIERLYNGCFNIINDKIVIDQNGAKEYIDFVSSLTFMYDTIVDYRHSNQVPMDNQRIVGNYATSNEIDKYNSYPEILKYIILNQLKSVISHSTYKVEITPANYFKGIERDELVKEVDNKMSILMDELIYKCTKESKKSM